MIRKQVYRYYCEFCKKSGCSGGHMKAHESSCTANPNRNCRMCGLTQDMPSLTAILKAPGNALEDWKAKMATLREAAEECPACILAAIRQSDVQKNQIDSESGPMNEETMYWQTAMANGVQCLGFHFKNERDAYLAEKHDGERGY